MKYGKNVTWFLNELASAELEQIEAGSIEIIGENEQGQEGSTEVEITDLAQAASDRIIELEHAIKETIGFIESTNSLMPEDGGESLKLLHLVSKQSS